MAPEMAQDRPPKIARKEPVQDGVIEGITRKEDEIKGVREEIKRKDDWIKGVTEEIKGLREEIRRMDEKIDEVIGPEQRKALEARLDFLRQQIQNYWLLISSLGEDKNRLREDINRLREEVLEESAVDKSKRGYAARRASCAPKKRERTSKYIIPYADWKASCDCPGLQSLESNQSFRSRQFYCPSRWFEVLCLGVSDAGR